MSDQWPGQNQPGQPGPNGQPAPFPGGPPNDEPAKSRGGMGKKAVMGIALAALFVGCVGGVGIGGGDDTETVASSSGDTSELEAELAEVRAERDDLEDQLAAAVETGGDTSDLEEQIEQLTADLEEARDDLAAAEGERDAAVAAFTAAEEQGTDSAAADSEPAAPSSGLATTFGNGTFEVGFDVAPGTYVIQTDEDFCSWHDEDFSQAGIGTGQHIIDLEDGDRVTSNGCGTWTQRR
jgi:seryl-tRNA synthetase